MVRAENTTLEMGPEALNGIGGDTTLGVFLDTVADYTVDIAFACKTVVCGQFVREHVRVIGNELFDNRHKGLRLSVLHLHGTYGSFTFHHTENGRLGLGATSLGLFRFLGFVLVRFTAAKVHFVHFHLAGKGGSIVLFVQGANLVENKPSGFLRDVNVTAELVGRNTLLVAADKVHCHKPLDKGNLGVLKDSSDKHRKVPLAMVATVAAVSTFYAMVTAAVRAYNVTLFPTRIADSTQATFLGIEVFSEFKNRVKVRKVNHIKVFSMS